MIAVDIGGTSAKGALVDIDGHVLNSSRIATGGSGAETVTRIADLLTDLVAAAGALGRSVVGAGVVSPGLIDSATGTVRYASTLGWTDVPLARLLSDATDSPSRSTTTCAPRCGRGGLRRRRRFAQRRLRGDRHRGRGIPHLRRTGRRGGHLRGRRARSHPGGARRRALRVRSARLPRGVLLGRGPGRRYAASAPLIDGETPDAASVIARVDTDPVAARVWSEGLDALATGLATLTLLVDPEVIVLGGGVAQGRERVPRAPARTADRGARVARSPPVDDRGPWARTPAGSGPRCWPSRPRSDPRSPARGPHLSSWLSRPPPERRPARDRDRDRAEQADAGRIAADLIVAALSRRSDPTLGLATGSSPCRCGGPGGALARPLGRAGFRPRRVRGPARRTPRELPRRGRSRTSSAPRTRPVARARSGRRRGSARRGRRAVRGRDRRGGGIDLQILGIGRTGHIGFNEPGSSLASRTRLKALTPATRADNARFFDSIDEVPTHCLAGHRHDPRRGRCSCCSPSARRRPPPSPRPSRGR